MVSTVASWLSCVELSWCELSTELSTELSSWLASTWPPTWPRHVGLVTVDVVVAVGVLRRRDDDRTTGTAGRSATVTAVVADADEPAATVAAVTAGRTAAAGVDVADLSVLAAAGVGGDIPTRLGDDVVAGVLEVIALAAGLDIGTLLGMHVAGVGAVVVVAGDVAVTLDARAFESPDGALFTTEPSDALMSRLKSKSRSKLPTPC